MEKATVETAGDVLESRLERAARHCAHWMPVSSYVCEYVGPGTGGAGSDREPGAQRYKRATGKHCSRSFVKKYTRLTQSRSCSGILRCAWCVSLLRCLKPETSGALDNTVLAGVFSLLWCPCCEEADAAGSAPSQRRQANRGWFISRDVSVSTFLNIQLPPLSTLEGHLGSARQGRAAKTAEGAGSSAHSSPGEAGFNTRDPKSPQSHSTSPPPEQPTQIKTHIPIHHVVPLSN